MPGTWCCFYCLVSESCLSLLQPHGLQRTRFLCPWDFPGKNTGVGCHFPFQGIFRPGDKTHVFLHWQVDSLALSYQGSPLFGWSSRIKSSHPSTIWHQDSSVLPSNHTLHLSTSLHIFQPLIVRFNPSPGHYYYSPGLLAASIQPCSSPLITQQILHAENVNAEVMVTLKVKLFKAIPSLLG